MSDVVNDAKKAWIALVFGIDLAKPATASPEGLVARMRKVGQRLQEMKVAGDPALPDLVKAFAQASAAAKIQALSAAMVEALEARTGPSAAPAPTMGLAQPVASGNTGTPASMPQPPVARADDPPPVTPSLVTPPLVTPSLVTLPPVTPSSGAAVTAVTPPEDPKKAQYDAALTGIKIRAGFLTAPIAKPEVDQVSISCIPIAEGFATATPPNYDNAIAALTPAAKLLDVGELHLRRWNAGYGQANWQFSQLKAQFELITGPTTWKVSCPGPTPGIEDLHAAANQIAFNANVAANNGKYSDAMKLLESVTQTIAPGGTNLASLTEYLKAHSTRKTEYDAAFNAAPAGPLRNALTAQCDSVIVRARTLAVTGDFKGGHAMLAGVDAPLAAISDVTAKWTQAQAAMGTLTDRGIFNLRDAVKTKYIDGATAAINGNNLGQATKLLDAAIAACPAIVAYGNALSAASVAIASAPTLSRGDMALIRDNFVVNATRQVEQEDYAGATKLLALVPAEVARATGGTGMQARFNVSLGALHSRITALDPVVATEKATLTRTYTNGATAVFTVTDPKPAFALLAQGHTACGIAEITAAQGLAYNAALVTARADVGKLVDAFVAPDRTAIETGMIDKARESAGAHMFQQALDRLAPVAEACANARAIGAQKVFYDPLLSGVTANYTLGDSNIKLIAPPLPPNPALNALLADVKTNHIDAATTLVANRGTGAAALTSMKQAIALLDQAGPKSFKLVNDSFFYVNLRFKKAAADTAMLALDTPPGNAYVATEIGELRKLMNQAVTLATAETYDAAWKVLNKVTYDAPGVAVTAAAAVAYATALTAANVRIATCKGKVNLVAPPQAPLIAHYDAMTAATTGLAAALATARDFPGAADLLSAAKLEPVCVAVETLATAATAYLTALKGATDARALMVSPLVQTEAVRIDTQLLTPAQAAAGKLDYPAAQALLTQAMTEINAAGQTVAGAAETQTARTTATGALAGNLPGAIAALEALLKPLLDHAEAAAIKDLTDPIQAAINAAKVASPPPDIRATLTAAADLCVPARAAAERHAAFKIAFAAAKKAVTDLASPLVLANRTPLENVDLPAAENLAKAPTRNFAGALAALDVIKQKAAAAAAIVDRDVTFQAAVVRAQNALDILNAISPLDPVIGTRAQDIQTTIIDAAKTLAASAAGDAAEKLKHYDDAEKLLPPVAAKCKALALARKMQGSGATPAAAPDAAEITDILDQPGGREILDAIMSSLPDSTPAAVVLEAVVQRFKLTSFKNVQDAGDDPVEGTGKSKTLVKIYQLMAKVPDKHTRDNPSLANLERHGGPFSLPANATRGSYFDARDPTKKVVVLSCGRGSDPAPQPIFNSPLVLPDVEPDCEMVPDSADSPMPTYFDWTTLHELGHTIDDKKKFMDGKAGDTNFGGWAVHGSNVVPVAEAIAAGCNLPSPEAKSFLISYLLGKNPVAPGAPIGYAADWAAAILAGKAWCDEIRVDKKFWDNGGGSTKRVSAGRVYHEAYPENWVSYDVAARTKGITGYQFRAPGEWLSELYAAFHSKKLKPSHPATAWLATL